jgi:hypothetical protein
MTRTAALVADAEHELMAGHRDRALALLLKAYVAAAGRNR